MTDTYTWNLASWRSNTGQDTHSTSLTSTQMQALFSNYSGNDFSLAAGSAAIDKGVGTFNSKSAPAYDIINMSRPQGAQWDVGAYEYDQAPTVTAVYVKGLHLDFRIPLLPGREHRQLQLYLWLLPSRSVPAARNCRRSLGATSTASPCASVRMSRFAQAQFAIAGSVGSYSVSGFAYSPTDHVATWSLSAVIGPDKLYIALPGSGATPVTDTAGNALDGEWTNPTSFYRC